MTTARLDHLAATGTNHVSDHIRLADDQMIAVFAEPGADAMEVFLFPGLCAPNTDAWEDRDDTELFLTGDGFHGSLYPAVSVEAVREFIEQHGGEHADQDSPPKGASADTEAGTAADVATRALAEWGITAYADSDHQNSWLVIGTYQGEDAFPPVDVPHALLYLCDPYGDASWMEVDCDIELCDFWRVVTSDGSGAQQHLITRHNDGLNECVEALADWLTSLTSPQH